ncbi:MAG: tRNA (adenosine(37)-N6)-threonylcarbamoyltransferase complex transferase subunit TsaD [Desulfovibrionales bacterium]
MLCLGIETSCDESAVALVCDGRLKKELVSSQADLHEVFGGVVPELASREHLRVLCPLLDTLFQATNTTMQDLQGIAVARGPGLLGSLLVGMGLAKGLALSLEIPLVGVNHLEAHLLAPGLETTIFFPALGLLVSGGHTQLYLMESKTSFQLLGRTLDDAAGEAFDKVAKLLNLPYPGGAHIDRLGSGIDPDTALFTRPYLDNQNLDFSFSGLKTAVANHVGSHPELRIAHLSAQEVVENSAAVHPDVKKLCASFNWTVADTLRIKVERALKRLKQVRSLVVAGGVAANSRVRAVMTEVARNFHVEIVLPSPHLCTDNAAMVAYAGEILLEAGLSHGFDVEAIPRGRAIPRDYLQTGGSLQEC